MMKEILNNWSIMRGLRLVIGVIALVQSIIQKDITLGQAKNRAAEVHPT